MLDDLGQQNNTLTERKSTSPEGVKPQRAARVKRSILSTKQAGSLLCVFMVIIVLLKNFYIPVFFSLTQANKGILI